MAELHEISLRERIRLNLLSAMDRANINQVQLAEKLGISKGTVNNWARGNNSPDVDMVPKICNVLGISILDLYTSTESEQSESKTLLKNSPSTDESAPGENSISMEESNRLLAALGFIKEGDQLSDEDLAFLTHVIGLLDAWFGKSR